MENILLEKVERGEVAFPAGEISVTDPCYDMGTYGRIDGVQIIPGTYKCNSWVCKKGDKWSIGRTFIAQILLKGVDTKKSEREYIGSIGVDAGLAGFYQNKPDYSDSEWNDFCDAFFASDGNDYLLNEYGFCTSSGFGDGSYDVYVYRNDYGVYCVEIEF